MDRQQTVVIPSFATETADPALDRLLNPARFFRSPRQLLDDDTIGIEEKRAILSSWASDACAVESMPALRQPPGAPEPVSFDEIMDALCHLDRDRDPATDAPGPRRREKAASARTLDA